MRLFWTLEAAKKRLDREENAVINAKNRQIVMLNKIIESHESNIEALTAQLTSKKGSGMEDRVIDMVENLLMPKQKTAPKTIDVQQTLSPRAPREGETGKIYSDDEIVEKLDLIPSGMLRKLVDRGQDEFFAIVKEKVSDISDESANRAYDLAVKKVSA